MKQQYKYIILCHDSYNRAMLIYSYDHYKGTKYLDYTTCTKQQLFKHSYTLEEATKMIKNFYRYNNKILKGIKGYRPTLIRLSKMKKLNSWK